MPLRFLFALLVIVGLHVYLGARLIGPFELPFGLRAVLWAALLGSVAVHPLAFSARGGKDEALSRGLAWASYLAMGAFAVLLSLTALRDALWLFAAGLDALLAALGRGPVLPEGEAARAFLAATNLGLLSVTFALLFVGFVEARRPPRVKRVRIPVAGLPEALTGLTIAQLTDVHIGPTIRRPFLDDVVDRVNALAPDLVAITGDLVDGTVEQLGPHVAPLGRLEARYGTFFATGNHEYYSGALPWVAFLRDLGIDVLLNEHRVLERGGAPFVVAGVCDYTAGQFVPAHAHDPERAVQGAPEGALKLLLAHQPRSALSAAPFGYDLMLSGHTHGGQFVPWNFFVPLQQPFVAGLHRVGRMWVYTSRGTGHWGPPLRLGAPSEITLLTLMPDEGGR